MATTVAFDPSTAKPVGFDPSTATPVDEKSTPNRLAKINSGPVAVSEAVQRGMIASLLGLPGELERLTPSLKTAVSGISPAFGKYIPSVGPILPTVSGVEDLLPSKSLAAAHPTAQNIGELLSAIIPLGGGVAKVAKSGEEIAASSPRLARFLPGASKRAEDISKIAKTSNMSDLGEKMMDVSVPPSLRTKYAELRQALRETKASNTDPAKLDQEFAKVYNEPRFAQINEFKKTPSGSQIDAKLRKFWGPEADNVKLVTNTFKSAQGIDGFRTMVGGDQKVVDQFAREYAANELQHAITKSHPEKSWREVLRSDIGSSAKAVDNWVADQEHKGWLTEKQVPETYKAIKAFQANIDATARAAQLRRYGEVGLGLLGLEQLWHRTPTGYWGRLLGF